MALPGHNNRVRAHTTMAETDVSHRYLGAHRAPPHAHRRHVSKCCDATRSYDRTATSSVTTLETVIKIHMRCCCALCIGTALGGRNGGGREVATGGTVEMAATHAIAVSSSEFSSRGRLRALHASATEIAGTQALPLALHWQFACEHVFWNRYPCV